MSCLLSRALGAAILVVLLTSFSQQASVAQTTTVPIPDLSVFDIYTDDDGPPGNSFFIDEEPIDGIPQFDPMTGSLTSIGISASFDIDYTTFLDTNGILSPGSPHQAFVESNFDFGIGFSSPSSLKSIATEFTDWSLGCFGEPTDMDGCQDFSGDSFTVEVSGSIDAEDFAAFIGDGDVGGPDGYLVAFIARPVAAAFEINNVGGAGAEFEASILNGQVTVAYSSNDGSTPESPLLPPPPGTLPPAFDDVDCESSFCIPGTIDEGGPGIEFPLFFDPPPAIGFDYEVVLGPNVAGIQIPSGFGDDLFQLLVSTDGVNFDLFGEIAADTFYDLTAEFPGGVSHLRLLGIEAAADVDPDDPQGFPTGLTFVSGSTQVGIAMTAITVPEPTTALSALVALCFGATVRRR